MLAFELTLDAIPASKARASRSRPPLERSEFMPLERDLAFIVKKDVRAGDIVKAAQQAERVLISQIDVFDVYEGPGVAEGFKSVAIALRLQPREKTLMDSEIEASITKIVREVERKTGAILRA